MNDSETRATDGTIRTSLQLAEQAIDGRISPRVSPLTTSRDIGALLSRTGFNLTTVDVDEVVVQYPSIFELMQDLRLMGESNAILNRPSMISRDILIAADAIYKEMHGNEDGTIPATFAIIYLVGEGAAPAHHAQTADIFNALPLRSAGNPTPLSPSRSSEDLPRIGLPRV